MASKKENEAKLWKRQYGAYVNQKDEPATFSIGDWVRISRLKGIFEKGYLANWSAEIFKIVSINYGNPTTYVLADYNGERIEGSFYAQELQKTNLTDVYLIERVIRRRKGEVLVKWLGWDAKYNSWIKESEVKKFTKK